MSPSKQNVAAAGADLQFADVGGNLLDYEIEAWTSVGESPVRIRISTLRAGSVPQAVIRRVIAPNDSPGEEAFA